MSEKRKPSEKRAHYKRLHARLHHKRGSANLTGPCIDCGALNSEWSQKHGTSGEDAYSDYEPRCRKCHLRYDNPKASERRVRGRVEYQYQLSWSDVEEIRKLALAGGSHRSIAERFRISRSHVTNIVNERTRSTKKLTKLTRRERRRQDGQLSSD